MEIEILLNKEIVEEFDLFKDVKLGTDEYEKTVNGLTKLIDRAIEIEKIHVESENQAKNREMDEGLKKQQMEEDRRDRLIKNCISVAGIVIPSIITVWGTLKSIEFEKEGTITTIMGRGFINKLLPKK